MQTVRSRGPAMLMRVGGQMKPGNSGTLLSFPKVLFMATVRKLSKQASVKKLKLPPSDIDKLIIARSQY